MRTMVRVSVALAVVGLGAQVARGDCSPAKVLYYKPDKLPDKPGSRCEIKNGKCSKIELWGYLFEPPKLKLSSVDPKVTAGSEISVKGVAVSAGGSLVLSRSAGQPPLLIFNHGSESNPGKKCDVGTYFSRLGFVVLVPHRRGQGLSTGATFDEYTKSFCSTPNQSGPCKMEYLHKQVEDIKEALNYVKGLKDGSKPLVDPARIALAGHSFGGIATMFANMEDLGQKAVINGAGASQSWEGNASASTEMTTATKQAVAPVYFLEPLNDHSIDALIVLARVAGQSCRQYQATLFPAVDTDGNGKITKADYSDASDADHDGVKYDPRDVAHGTFMSDTAAWGPAAIEFMTRYFEKPAQPFDTLCEGTSHDPPSASD